ncbi:30S ribosomal protein S3 [Candidatus Woesearchaeota archaeon]|nr:30S ribosomal protein S3 [Candidatus Woesearchaeota archaeon]
MIERQIVASNVKEHEIQEYIMSVLKNLGHSHIKLQRTPLGEKIIIHASRPGLIVGRKGQNIKKLTEDLKGRFKLENPQIEINEVESPNLDAQIVAERIASSLEKFGTQRFKGVGHKVMADVMGSGALGVEILITGKIPSSRAKRWRFYQGYLKKCGDIALEGVRKAYTSAQLKTGSVGIQVRIMPPETLLPDEVNITEEPTKIVEELKDEAKKDAKAKKPKKAEAKEEKKPAAVKPAKKASDKKETKKPAKEEKEAKQTKPEEPKQAAAAPSEEAAPEAPEPPKARSDDSQSNDSQSDDSPAEEEKSQGSKEE